MGVKLVNLSGPGMELRNKEKKNENQGYICKEYKGLKPHQIAQKAAWSSSDRGRCWWIYEYIYKRIMYP
tara:strand:- start:3129 stop:3335 length:207 start_codon:yes stop_codon:yes gene_type:complete